VSASSAVNPRTMTLVNTIPFRTSLQPQHCYSIYGVRVTSDFPLAFAADASSLDADPPLADVEFVEGDDRHFAPFTSTSADDEFLFEEASDGTAYLRWRALYEFKVAAGGTRVACRPLDGCGVSVLQNFLFSQVLAVALVRQGIEPLHAAVMRVGAGAIGLLGDCTYGKSTLLAAFAASGHRMLTDDMLILRRHAGALHALPGSGRIKLLPDSARRFLGDPASGMPLTPMNDKRSFALDESRQQRESLPLRRLFVLPDPDERDRTDTIEICSMSRAETVCAILKNTFTTLVVDRERLARQFDFATRLAFEIDGFQLRYPTGLHHLEDIRDAILEHSRVSIEHHISRSERND
jgi:hypothetical protein